jgi:TPR repeat protein
VTLIGKCSAFDATYNSPPSATEDEIRRDLKRFQSNAWKQQQRNNTAAAAVQAAANQNATTANSQGSKVLKARARVAPFVQGFQGSLRISVSAQYNLAVMHFEKFLNPGKAAELLRRCTKSGHAPSLFLHGKMHESGDVGGGKNPVKAALYYRVALAKAGDDDNLRRKVQRRLAGLGEVANRPLVPWPTNV